MSTIAQMIIAAAQRYGVDPRLAVEVAISESNLNQSLVSRAGAIGVMQLMPATARDLGVNPYDLAQNVDGGVRYLQQMLSRFGDTATALAAYNAGPSTVAAILRQGGWDQLPQETRLYVQRILSRVGEWQQQPVITPNTVSAASQVLSSPDTQKSLLILLALFLALQLLRQVAYD